MHEHGFLGPAVAVNGPDIVIGRVCMYVGSFVRYVTFAVLSR